MKKIKQCENILTKQYEANNQLVLGLDEAGRGPLAGPLVVAGVIFPLGYQNADIYDSKSLSEKKRDLLFEQIQEDALRFYIDIVSVNDIDRYNIYQADKLSMMRIANILQPDVVLTDAMPFGFEKPVIDLVKGDQKELCIAAASILAKVTRDRIMIEYDKQYPEYHFAKNKGYGTKQHMEAIELYGITPIHRRSFAPACYLQQTLDI